MGSAGYLFIEVFKFISVYWSQLIFLQPISVFFFNLANKFKTILISNILILLDSNNFFTANTTASPNIFLVLFIIFHKHWRIFIQFYVDGVDLLGLWEDIVKLWFLDLFYNGKEIGQFQAGFMQGWYKLFFYFFQGLRIAVDQLVYFCQLVVKRVMILCGFSW